MPQFLEHFLLQLQQEVVVVLHLLGWVHHEGTNKVGAVGFVADAHGTSDSPKVHVVLLTGKWETDEGKWVTGGSGAKSAYGKVLLKPQTLLEKDILQTQARILPPIISNYMKKENYHCALIS